MVSFLLPIILSLGIGIFCKQKKLLDGGAVEALKTLVTTFFLPMLSFRMFSTAALEGTAVFLGALSFGLLSAALLLGFASRRFLGEYGEFGRFLMSSAEGGMIGVGLFQMLYGPESLSYLAPIELGQGLFYFLVYLSVLTGRCMPPSAQRRSAAARAAVLVKRILTTPVFDGCLAGMLYQLLRLPALSDRIGLTEPLYACIDEFTALIIPLILIAIGYELSFSREVWRAVLKSAALRAGIMGVCALAGIFVMRTAGITDLGYSIALAFEFSLPPSFLIVVYVKDRRQQQYLNAALSFYVLVTLFFAAGFHIFLKIG